MESLDGNCIVCNKLMSGCCAWDGLGWWGETRWEVWIFDLTNRQGSKVVFFCCIPLLWYATIIHHLQLYYHGLSMLEKTISPPHTSLHIPASVSWCMKDHTCVCFLREASPSQGRVCYLLSDRETSRKCWCEREVSDIYSHGWRRKMMKPRRYSHLGQGVSNIWHMGKLQRSN